MLIFYTKITQEKEIRMDKRKITVYRSRTDLKSIENPLIMLQGKWLHDAGFSVGDKVAITCQDGKLVVEKVGMAAEGKTGYMGEAVC